jgi:transcriptional regulator with XRE-family HTH domain
MQAPPDANLFGPVLKAARERKAFSFVQVQAATGISHAAVIGYERNGNTPSFLYMALMCDLYELDLNEPANLVRGPNCRTRTDALSSKKINGNTLPEILKAARRAKGLTIRAVQAITGISNVSVNKYENDKAKPSFPATVLLCDAYGIAITALARAVLGMQGNTFGPVLKAARERKDLSFKAVEVLTGISASEVLRYENDGVEPSFSYMVLLCEAYDLDLNSVANLARLPGDQREGNTTQTERVAGKSLGQLLRAGRLSKQLSTRAVRGITDISNSLVSRYETNTVMPSFTKAVRLADLYGIPIQDLARIIRARNL